jgi:hypothetical protein
MLDILYINNMRKESSVIYIMANLQNYRNNKHHGISQGLGQKVKDIAKLAGTVKSIYDTGKAVYSIAQVAAPYIIPLLVAL